MDTNTEPELVGIIEQSEPGSRDYEQAFRQLYALHSGKLAAYCRELGIWNNADADELTAHAFRKCFAVVAAGKFDAKYGGSLYPLLKTSLLNVIRDEARRRKRKEEGVVGFVSLEKETDDGSVLAVDVVDPATEAEPEFDGEEARAWLMRVLTDVELRAVAAWMDNKGNKYAAARESGLSRHMFAKHWNSAIYKMRGRAAAFGMDLSDFASA